MQSNPLTFWNSGIWLIPILLVATIAILYFAARQFQKRTNEFLKNTRREFRTRLNRRRQISSQVSAHSHTDQEPYRSPMSKLKDHLTEFDVKYEELEQQFVGIQEDIRRQAGSPGLAIIGAPLIWYQLHRRAVSLDQSIPSLDVYLDQAETTSLEVVDVAWEVASRFRMVGRQHIEDQRLLDELSNNHVAGKEIEDTLEQQEKIRDALRFIPEYFFEGEQETVKTKSSGQDGKDAVIAVYQVLSQIQPVQDVLDKKVKRWSQDYQNALAQIEKMQAQISNLEGLLGIVQDDIDLTTEDNILKNLEVIAQNLADTLSRLEIENLQSIIAESKRVERTVVDLQQQVRTAREELDSLNSGIPSLSKDLQALTMQFASLATSAVRPVAWGRSRAALTNLTRQTNTLSQTRQKRTPSQLHQEAESAQRLYKQFQELAGQCYEISAQHREFQNLVNAPEFNEWRQWLSSAEATSALSVQYSPENWVRSDAINTLESDLSSLGAVLETLILDPEQPIGEDEIDEALNGTRNLLQVFQSQRQRVANIQAHMEDIQAEEKNAREQLDRTGTVFQQAFLLLKSNSFLMSTSGEDARRLQKELQSLSDNLRQRDRGSVNKKARQVEILVEKTTTTIEGWSRKLSEEINDQLKDISATVASLDAIASLDEPVIDQARSLLSAAPSYGAKGTPASGMKPSPANEPLDPSLEDLRRLCQFSEQLIAGGNALDDLADGILQNYETANTNRQVARDQIQEIADWMRSSRGWPPLSVSFLEERQELGILEDQWGELKQQRFRGMALAAQLGNLGARYQALSERVRRSASRAAKDQEEVIAVENEVSEAVQKWQEQAGQVAGNQTASREIRELLSNTEKELTEIRRSAQQGRRDFNQAVQALRLLSRNLNIALVMIDEEHSIDIRGREIRKR